MNCFECCVEVDEAAAHVWTTEIRRARLAHFCGECGRCIPPGAPYRKEAAVYDGSVNTHKTCRLCASVRDDRFRCGWYWGGVWEMLEACMREYGETDDEWLDPPDWPIEVTP